MIEVKLCSLGPIGVGAESQGGPAHSDSALLPLTEISEGGVDWVSALLYVTCDICLGYTYASHIQCVSGLTPWHLPAACIPPALYHIYICLFQLYVFKIATKNPTQKDY